MNGFAETMHFLRPSHAQFAGVGCVCVCGGGGGQGESREDILYMLSIFHASKVQHSGNCPPKTYGMGCGKNCSVNCAGPNNPCDPVDGNCTLGCTNKIRYIPPRCDKGKCAKQSLKLRLGEKYQIHTEVKLVLKTTNHAFPKLMQIEISDRYFKVL